MNKKVLLIISISLFIIGINIYFIFFSGKCYNASGTYNIIFNTNGGDEIDNISVCTSCDEVLPIPTKDGSYFDGWYYDAEFTNPVVGTSTSDISLIKDNKFICTVGYNDITLYAKWNNDGINIDKTSIVLKVGESEQINILNDISDVKWSCSDEKIATVNNGLVTAISEGYTTLLVEYKDIKVIIQVVVATEIKGNPDVTYSK